MVHTYNFVTLVDKITEALDKGECIIGVFLIFSEASDIVDHGILLQKHELNGIQDITLKWFKDYLSNRIQHVTYNGIKSMTDIINTRYHKDLYSASRFLCI